ncbi:MAG TPA: 2-oxoacid:acceptor oxidoreductase family protein [Propionicimonas sp.]|uniref:2-oxoacid:acceptor oxidoreductase family protein n=1 Tax=Propionicimonas sp. TaxID=1955623 RepID=UPI002F40EC3A
MSAHSAFPGIPEVINGNGAVAHVMKHVCGGVIGYPITPSTEIAELFEAARAEGQLNVWGKHPFFVETEGEHSAQSGALGAALVGGNFISNASSSQGILYGLESHYVTVGKKIGGFVLQVAARVVTRHSLNVMAGHDDVYALLPTGYTILFGSNPQEAADLAAISFRASALSLIPVANAMDGFATSHMMSEVRLPEPELLRAYLGDPAGRIPCPTVAQEMLFGAKGRVFQLQRYLVRHADDFDVSALAALRTWLDARAPRIEADDDGELVEETLDRVPSGLHAQWRRQWLNAWPAGTRQLVPALVDPHNPGLTGPVQNQPDFQAGSADHRTHFANAVPALVRQSMAEFAELTGRSYSPVMAYDCEDADYVMVGMGSITDDVQAVLGYLRAQGLKVGVASVKLLQPFPEAELVAAIGAARAVTVLERSDDTALTRMVTQALFHARANGEADPAALPYPGIAALPAIPRMTTAIFGLGGHDIQPRYVVAAFHNMTKAAPAPLVYLGSQFFTANPTPVVAAIQERLRQAYPETELMALETGDNPPILAPGTLRIRFHSVGGYGTVATGKLLTDVLASLLGMHSKSAPKYGSEKSGAATNYYITLSPEPVLLTNAELEDVEVVVAPDHQAFSHTNPLKGLVGGGTLIMQSDKEPLQVWQELPAFARRTIRDRGIRFLVLDAFAVARAHAPNPELETRMMGIAFIGAILGHVDGIARADSHAIEAEVRAELSKKFGRRGETVIEANMAVIRDGMKALTVDYTDPAFAAVESAPALAGARLSLSGAMTPSVNTERTSGLFDPGYYEEMMARPFREGTIDEAPVLPGTGLFMPIGTGAAKNKGIFRRTVPIFDAAACTACMECALACPDNAIPNTGHEIGDLLGSAIEAAGLTGAERATWYGMVPAWTDGIRQAFRDSSSAEDLASVARGAAAILFPERDEGRMDDVVAAIAAFPVSRTRPLYDALEKQAAGSGVLFSAVIDPWKCTGCLQCIEVCGPDALTSAEQDDVLLGMLETRFERLTQLPDSPARLSADATAPGGDIKRILLNRSDYYSMTGGHGACRGCGEVTAIHLLNSLTHRIGEDRRQAHLRELDETLDQLSTLSAKLSEGARRQRVTATMAELERRLYLYESGPTGDGPSSTVMANSTGCSSVYASTVPFSPYLDPWVNGLFQDAQPLAMGIYEGLVSGLVAEVRALRIARLELTNSYDAELHDAELSMLSWRDFTPFERTLVPVVLTISGDGAAFDIGFGAMSRVLAGGTPIKSLVLDTGGYSNTGGQASTASFAGQDADLARYGTAHSGKQESRKELGLLAAFHPGVFVCSTATAFHSHFLRASADLIGYNEGAALMIAYTPCDTENGMPEDLANARSRLAVESRVNPLFVHDPRRGDTLAERFSLDGNPEPDGLWTETTLTYRDDRGQLQLLTMPLTPADFAIGEVRFARQFRWLANYEEAGAVPIAEFVELPAHQRTGRTPFVYTTDRKRRLVKMACSASIVALVEDRKRYWRTLQFLAGQSEAVLSAQHRVEVTEWTVRYGEAIDARESALDVIAKAMADLATASGAPAGGPLQFGLFGSPLAAPESSTETVDAPTATDRPIWLDLADLPRCNDCATCYQELPQLFEKATIVVEGNPQTVGRMRPDALDGLELTAELSARISRVKATCDAEIIQ